MRLFRRRRLNREARILLVMRHIQEHGPSYIYDVSKSMPFGAGATAMALAWGYADGYLNHKPDPDPSEYGSTRWTYALTPAGRRYLEQADE